MLLHSRLQPTRSDDEEDAVVNCRAKDECDHDGAMTAALMVMLAVDTAQKRHTSVAHSERQKGGTGLEPGGRQQAAATSRHTWRLCRKKPSQRVEKFWLSS